ncbi:MAG: MerR family transcriptional regulator [Planctomycetota bacterium]|jgi:DNA-binding transcriptional MerR regulator|nr:MerR family transcriptional regulator [Planctomycetota bacterium]
MEARATKRIGELAEQTGITVRTLHHYEELGLLVPSHRSEANHRLYSETDLLRLQQILSLRQIGLPLAQIGELLADPECSVEQVLQQHLEWLEQEGDRIQRLRSLLINLQKSIAAGGSSLEQVTQTLQWTQKMDKYLSKEQQQILQDRHDAMGAEGMAEAQKQWAQLGEDLVAAVEDGVDPSSEDGKIIGRRFRDLMAALTGGDQEIEHAVGAMNQANPDMLKDHGWPTTPETQDFLHKAVHADA